MMFSLRWHVRKTDRRPISLLIGVDDIRPWLRKTPETRRALALPHLLQLRRTSTWSKGRHIPLGFKVYHRPLTSC